MQSIYLAGGCFWCTEAAFSIKKGVLKVVPGYMGGKTKNPSYEEVCSGNTGHAEAIKCDYNEKIISLDEILEYFFKIHDPTQVNKQGNDVGTQYRSAIFVDSLKKKKLINSFLKKLQVNYNTQIATEVSIQEKFYIAEEYHHNYFKKNPSSSYCTAVIKPKIDFIKKTYLY